MKTARELFTSKRTMKEDLKSMGILFPKHDDFFGTFNKLIVEQKEGAQQVDIRDIDALEANKSGVSELKDFRDIIDFNRLLSKYKDMDAVAESIFYADHDSITQRDHPIPVKRQAWDNYMTVANNGGGHRLAALWLWHTDNEVPRMLNCEVTDFAINPSCVQKVREYHLLIVDERKIPAPIRLLLVGQKYCTLPIGRCYAIPKSTLRAALCKNWMKSQNDLSEYILRAI